MHNLISEIRISLLVTLCLATLVCAVYPLAVWGVAQTLFPYNANGSMIVQKGKTVGSRLIAQNFTEKKYFHPRPSAAGESGYDATSSGGSNLGPTSQKLIDSIGERVTEYRTENNLPQDFPVPADAVTASASGLDPNISLKNALIQARRVAKARNIDEMEVIAKIEFNKEGRDLGILGEPRVNVLMLNLALDAR